MITNILLALIVTASAAESKKVVAYTTAQNTKQRFAASEGVDFAAKPQPTEGEITIFVDPNKTFQTIFGFGGALTDASAETYAKLPKELQKEVMTAYFDKEKGLGYTIARTTIHSSDFSSGSYTYIEEGDKDLKTFNVEHDRKFRIPFIKDAIKAAGGKLTMYASPWSPPAFMKDSNNMLRGGKLKKEFFQPWADYYVKFIKAYEAEGIPLWGITIQNEPMATQKWESCLYTAEEERDFLKNFLGPTMKKAGLGDKKIIGWDHNRDLVYQRASVLLDDPEAKKYLWGIGFHWYETWAGGGPMFDNLKRATEAYPDVNFLFTEGTEEKFKFNRINDWKLGERYGEALIQDFNAGSVGFTDWNILLDETGGPNHVGNFCFAPVLGHLKKKELIYTNQYYYIGHFSKWVKPGAKRITASSSRSHLTTTAFKNPDGSVVVVVMNATSKPYDYSLWVKGQAAPMKSPARSIQTLVF